MILKKAMSVILSAAMFSLAVIPAYAADTNGGQTTPVTLASEAAAFKVTIPAVLPVHISADGAVTVSNAAQVENGSSAPIRVTNIAINEKAGWSKVATVSSKVGLKEFTFDCAVTNPVIPSKSASGIEYSSTVSPQRTTLADTSIADVIFTVAWDEAGNAEIIDPNPSGYPFVPNDVKILTLNFSNIYADTDEVTWTSSNDAIATVADHTSTKAGLQGSKQCKVTAHAVGEATITGTLKDGATSSFNVTVADKAFTSIAVTTPPTKTAYIEGENFDATGMVVTATYNNGSSEAVTGYTLSNNTSLVGGQASVTVSYGGKTATTPITVAAIEVERIKITKSQNKTKYVIGEKFDPTGMEVTAYYNNGTSELVTGYTVPDPSMTVTYQTSVKVTYGGQYAYAQVTVEYNYKLATDADFSGVPNSTDYPNLLRYIGTEPYVEIPTIIKGVTVTSYEYMFQGNNTLKGVKSTNKNVTNAYGMFSGATVSNLDLTLLDTSRVTDTKFMFANSYTERATGLNTSNVINMNGMFENSKASRLELYGLDTREVQSMMQMFGGAEASMISGLWDFDTSNVTNMTNMFSGSKATTLDLSSFDTSNVTHMGYMFRDSQATTLDLSSFDTSNVTDMDYMFSGCRATTGYARTQADADRFNASSDKPEALTFIVK